MDFQSFLTYLVLVVFVGAWWNNFRLRNKIQVIYTNIAGQEIKRLVPILDHYVSFDGMDFELTPDRARDILYDEGMFGKLFPTRIKCYHLNYSDYLPENYKNTGVQWESPANRKLINSRNNMQVFSETQTPNEAPKKSKMMKYLPWIIGAVLLFGGYYIYTYISNQNAQIAALQNYINAIK